MSKKMLLGALIGGVATYAAWKKLPLEKQQQLRDQVADFGRDVADQATDYALEALDIVDEKLAEHDANFDKASSAFDKARDIVKDGAGKAVNHFTDDDFDQQTADIRAKLAGQKNKNNDDDIVIDATNED